MAEKKITKAKAEKPKKITSRKPALNEEDIRKKAEEIYYDRIARGIDSTPEDDWHKAEKLLKASKK
jgi:hypothetical protein